VHFKTRRTLYRQIETERDTRLLAFVTSDRAGMETQIAQDCIDLFVDLLDKIGPSRRISLLLHTNGGQTSAAWRLINLIRTFCDELEVLIPLKALSAGTLISLGADKIVVRGLVESTGGGCYAFLSEGTLTQVVPQPGGSPQITDQRTFEGWRKIA
jgi:ATP-dependent protease ClpP protease subunit